MSIPNPTIKLDDDEVTRRVANLLEGLYNLNYLIGEEADHSVRVRSYVGIVDSHLKRMTELLVGKSAY